MAMQSIDDEISNRGIWAYAASEDATIRLEEERRRIAEQLERQVAEPLHLLLAQANAYEQTAGANGQAKLTASVLSSLARQVLQHVRNLQANLQPTILDTLGLEAGLESLASQTMLLHGIQINLALQRLHRRLLPNVELALFRTVQDVLFHAIGTAHASQMTIRLDHHGNHVVITLTDNGSDHSRTALQPSFQRIRALGGVIETRNRPDGVEVVISVQLAPDISLTDREIDVLRLLLDGRTNKEMAAALAISARTVKFHLDNIYSKIGVNSRTEAAVFALQHGLLRT
jgi:DNA-binding CsgD family transcriptional regulator/glucose-6-phosphate-specific signal transduction histidine kinase